MADESANNSQKLTVQRARRWERAFLASLALTGNVTEAAQAAKIARRTAYQLREASAEFALEWDEAIDESADLLEKEAKRRAVEGWEEPVYQRGEKVGTVRKYSDTLLILLLKGNKPSKFRDNVDMTSSGKELSALTMPGLTDADKLAIISAAQRRLESKLDDSE